MILLIKGCFSNAFKPALSYFSGIETRSKSLGYSAAKLCLGIIFQPAIDAAENEELM